jgi:hypothetical protein
MKWFLGLASTFTLFFAGALWYRAPAASAAEQLSPSPLVDTDGDGIPDDWEINGVPITLPDGSSGRWRLQGASPTHKDVFVWIAWMEQGKYTHKPRKNRNGLESYPLERVVKAFSQSPVPNPDGTSGINLHLLYSDAPVGHVNLLGTTDEHGAYDWTKFQELKNASFPPALAKVAGVFHYVLFAHQINFPDENGGNCTSGISRDIPSVDFIVSLGCNEDDSAPNPDDQGNSEWQSGTFMHELGHNLGLRHGGADDINYKPNYVSIMNYLFQFSGIFRDKVQGQFDYSRFDIQLDENKLIPQKGISSDATLQGYGSAHLCGPPTNDIEPILSLADPVRWDCSSEPQSHEVSFDVNLDGCVQTLFGYQDWPNIVLAGRGTSPTRDCPSPTGASSGRELDARKAALAPVIPVQGVRTTPTREGILVQWDRIRLDSVRGYEVFRQRPGGRISRLTQTRKDSFLDDSAQSGVQYIYQVGAVATLPNPAVLKWVQEKERQMAGRITVALRDVGQARFGLPASGSPGQIDLSYRTALSAPVSAKLSEVH